MFNTSKTVEDKLLEYARIEHARKMQVLEEEHHLQMEILTIQRDRASLLIQSKENVFLTNFTY
jgi:hypothetical protein